MAILKSGGLLGGPGFVIMQIRVTGGPGLDDIVCDSTAEIDITKCDCFIVRCVWLVSRILITIREGMVGEENSNEFRKSSALRSLAGWR